MVVELVAAGAILVLASLIARWGWVRSRHPVVPGSLTEEEARENAAPLTRAVLSASRRVRRDTTSGARSDGP